MFFMKKLCVLSVIFVLIAIFSGGFYPTFYAQEVVAKPHIVIGEDVWLLSTDGSRLFLLPKTYYAEILSMDDYYYFVSFNGISGRVKKSEVTTVGYHAVAIGTQAEIKVSPDYAEFSALLLKKTPDLSGENVTTIPINSTFTFVGMYPVEDTIWYAVKWEQHFGYVKADRTNNPNIVVADFVPDILPTPDPEPDAPQSGSSTTEQNGTENSGTSTVVGALTDLEQDGITLKIVLIIGLIIPALIVIVLLFRPLTRRRR